MTLTRKFKRIWHKAFPWLRVVALIGLIAYAIDKGDGPPRYHVSGQARIVDGDSLFVDGLEIRLKNIDAPEGQQNCQRGGKNWRCGQEATRRLHQLIKRRKISCKGTHYDKHNRLLAFCSVGGFELNKWMITEGWAVAFGDYHNEERAAKRAKKGIWSSQFQRPRTWRAQQRR
ncbi:MAG: thermonuclease family protein [bacterium]|nr:thermonuclease family protein [bacterium]